ncbi:hypothetical protein PY793_02865 [Acetobacter fabarum]|uniref:hypothetical protein n=1 Tax=Acetobacter fabarum TaxID=483199 RepID=UPI00312B573F
MPRLFYLLLLGGMFTPVAQTMADTAPPQAERTGSKNLISGDAKTKTTNTLNAHSLAHRQCSQPTISATPPALQGGTIAKGTGVLAPDLQATSVYNPADRQQSVYR